jgi:glycosyltransferase involved in cell wall biosynthesis
MRSGSAANVVKAVRYWFGPRELQWHMRKVRRVIAAFSPDVVHAMRIPFEGMLASQAIPTEFPLLVSVWGNDFTLHATRRPLMKRLTRDTLRRADALHCDCERDLRLAHELGFDHDKPTLVLPGAGGVQQNLFAPGGADVQLRRRLNIPHGAPVIINPRGFRAYVRNDKFFDAMPRVLKTLPDAVFICNGMAGNSVAENWVESHGIAGNVRLLPTLPRNDMAGLFRIADISVSPSTHDGTPNSMLEAMSCGCFPVAGDIESVREWITDGVNGLLCDATNADSQATAMIRALDDVSLRERAKKINLKLISERAEYNAVMQRAEAFYYDVIESHKAGKLLT